MSKAESKIHYDCSRCPGYCCSYPRIEVLDSDLERLAAHFGLSQAEAERKYTRWYVDDDTPLGTERILRHRKDAVYGSICKLFDTKARRCTAYEGRPEVCRDYPNGKRCGYYEFLRFERKHQDDPDFVPLT